MTDISHDAFGGFGTGCITFLWRRAGWLTWIVAVPTILFLGAASPLALEARALALLMPLALFPRAIKILRAAARLDVPCSTDGDGAPVVKGMILSEAVGAAAALAAIPAVMVAPGLVGAALALPWLVFAVWIAARAMSAILRRQSGVSTGNTPSAAALLYLPVGAAWLMAAAGGLEALGFTEPIVSLTAAHFHFAGFGATCLIAYAADVVARADGAWTRRTYAVARAICVIGPALVALGITFSYRLEGPAAAVYALGVAAFAAIMLGPVRRAAASTGSKIGFVVSALSALFAMGFAFLYAARGWGLARPPAIPTMIVVHGAVNALGFIGVGLVTAARVIDRAEETTPSLRQDRAGSVPKI